MAKNSLKTRSPTGSPKKSPRRSSTMSPYLKNLPEDQLGTFVHASGSSCTHKHTSTHTHTHARAHTHHTHTISGKEPGWERFLDKFDEVMSGSRPLTAKEHQAIERHDIMKFEHEMLDETERTRYSLVGNPDMYTHDAMAKRQALTSDGRINMSLKR